MGEVFHALQHLNESLKLGLSGEQLSRAESSFKSRFAQISNPDPVLTRLKGNEQAIAEEYEFVAVLQPRARKIATTELRTMADTAVKTNLAGVKLGAIKVDLARLQAGTTKTGRTRAPTVKVDAGKVATVKTGVAKAAGAKAVTTKVRAAKAAIAKVGTKISGEKSTKS